MTAAENDENDLIRRAQSGDAAAFQWLAEQQADPLFRCALALCRDRHWAEDLAQDTLVEAWRSLSRFDGRCRLSTWLYGILRHRFLKGFRRKSNSALASLESTSAEVLTERAPSPVQVAESSEDSARVRQAITALPDEHRLVVELRFFAGASLDEIAVAIDCPLGTVKSRLHHALEKLRKMNFALNLFDNGGQS